MKPLVPLMLALTVPALIAPAQTDTFATELKTLQTEYSTEQRKFIQPTLPDETPEQRVVRVAMQRAALANFRKKFNPKLVDLYTRAKGTPTGLAARMFALQINDITAEAIDSLVEAEAKNPDMARHLPLLSRMASTLAPDKSKDWLSAIEAATPYDGVKATILLTRASSQKGDEAVIALKALVEKYPTTNAAAQAKPMLFALENLQIGKVAPEIEGKDEKGEKITLSEYRGKVVVLDFWGFW